MDRTSNIPSVIQGVFLCFYAIESDSTFREALRMSFLNRMFNDLIIYYYLDRRYEYLYLVDQKHVYYENIVWRDLFYRLYWF